MAMTPARRSLGLKFLLVCALALVMSIPAFAVFGLVYDRTSRAEGVVNEVGQQFGGRQVIFGPILVAPYKVTRFVTLDDGKRREETETGWYMMYAENGSAIAAVDTDVRNRSELFTVRTYTATIDLAATFDLSGQPNAAPENAVVDWSRATLMVGVGDPRGAAAEANIAVTPAGAAARTLALQPGSAFANVLPNAVVNSYDPAGKLGAGTTLQWLVAPAAGLAAPNAKFEVASKLAFTGVENFSLGAFAKNTQLSMSGDWEHVGYFGAFPRKNDVAPPEDGTFSARWTVPFVARGLAAAGPTFDMGALSGLIVQAKFIDPGNPYQAVTRSLKYAIMFLGVVFLAYFLFEATADRRVHPAQYILVGLAQIIFYLLLLSIAERVGFDLAFVIAAGATVGLISAYAGAVFGSVQRGLVALAVFSGLYALIYLLMKLEDFALLAGSITAFVAIAAVMWATRNLNWYDLGAGETRAGAPPKPAGEA